MDSQLRLPLFVRGLLGQQRLPLLIRVFFRDESHFSSEEAASNFVRFFRSKHVVDLRLICYFAIAFFVVQVCITVYLTFHGPVPLPTSTGATPSEGAHAAPQASSSAGTYLTAFIPLYAAIIAWTYLSAGKRLGVVDLFACEIATLCRVGTIFDIGTRYVQMYKLGASRPVSSDSSENYFPIFDKNSDDLQALEALVVNNITEFYTYMKAERDALRLLARVEPSQGVGQLPHAKLDAAPWHTALANVIYLTFLGYESARKAIGDLVEFQPTQAENMIVILLTEVVCYSFLCNHFDPKNLTSDTQDLRHVRLTLRLDDYKKEIPELYDKVDAHGRDEKDWIKAKNSLSELANRYREAFGEDIRDAVARIKRDKAAVTFRKAT